MLSPTLIGLETKMITHQRELILSTLAVTLLLGLRKKKTGVARSSTEAEYRSVAATAAEICWITSLMKELGLSISQIPAIYCDNMGATYLAANPVFHSRMKHLALDYHFVRHQVQNGVVRVSHVSAHDQLADALTKPLSRPHFEGLCIKIGLSSGGPS